MKCLDTNRRYRLNWSLIVLLFSGCSTSRNVSNPGVWFNGQSDHEVVLSYGRDTLPPFQAYFTWEPVTAAPEEASYTFNGVNVGTGDKGFANVLKAMSALPPHSIILMYPEFDDIKDQRPLTVPWADHGDELNDTLAEHDLMMVVSPWDRYGKLLGPPDYK